MQDREEPRVEDAISEIAVLLATAYRRRANIRLVHSTREPLASTEELANSGEPSVHELTLTRQRKDTTPQ
jgi:hypothetical protein